MNPIDLRQVVGSNVRRLREEEGLSQEALAAMAGVDRSYLSRLETGSNYAGLRTIAKLASVLDVDPADLLRQQS